MNRSSKLEQLAVSDSGFLFDPSTGATFSVNPTGLMILRSLQQGQSRDMIAAQLGSTFNLGSADVDRDIDDFVAALRQIALVPAEFSL